ncbi:MAG: hypothetical protein NUW21_03535 [Elusimicrobia bacterium]|nr:hypothetical protein [Elusimicrobiota bacterium]
MLRTGLVLALSAVLAAAARAEGEEACRPLPGVGCWFAPEGAPPDAPLLVYLRGHHRSHGPNVPAGLWLASSRQAFAAYELGRTAREKGVVVLVTYRSGLGVKAADVAAVAAEAKRTFPTTILAAHSGGYVGLGATLDAGLSPSRVVMLDNFYGAGAGGLTQKLQRAISAGAACAGFHTPHNKKNYDKGYRNAVACSVDAMASDADHGAAVVRCLAGYLDGRSCLR